MRSISATSFFLAVMPGMVVADPATECGGSSQIEIGACIAETLARVDATIDIYLCFAMNAAHELDDATGRKIAVPALEAGQTAWAAYREAHCECVGAPFGGGSGKGIGINSCKIELGRDRAAELMRLAQ